MDADGLVEFVRAQLDEDEHVAREALEAPIAADWAATYPSLAESGVYRRGEWWACPAKGYDYQGRPRVVRVQIQDGSGADPTYSGPAPYVVTAEDEREAPIMVHIARWDPARVLREVEAKRRLLQQFELRGNSVRATVVPATGGVWDDPLRILALPYSDRPGFRSEWAP